MGKKIAIGLLAVIVVLVAVIATRPADFKIERSAAMAAPPEIVFAHVNDFHEWAGWSPWDKMDPSMKRTYSGPASGVGASYHWVGNDKVGEGQMTIVESVPSEKVSIKLEFLKPFAATNPTTFTFALKDGATQVTWAMTGTNNFMMKGMGLFMNMDKMVGDDFERGLAQMKVHAEADAKKLVEDAIKAKADAEAAAPPAQVNAGTP